MQTTTRNATLPDLIELLSAQHARKLDLVVPATAITATGAQLVIRGADPIITEEGVTAADGTYTPTVVADEGIADKLGIPVSYLRRLREERPDLYDGNVNGWLHGRREKRRFLGLNDQGLAYSEVTTEAIPGDGRNFMIRAFRGDTPGAPGIARALLSDKYLRTDNLDVLVAALDGIRHAGIEAEVKSADLTDRRMVVRINAPAITALAPTLLAGYRSPFTGASGDDNPVVSAGLRITNSEVGGGAFTIAPEVTVLVCTNGMTMTRDAVRRVHIGERQDAGVTWAADTQTKELELIQLRVRDAVTAFLSPEYLESAVSRLEQRAGTPVDASEKAIRDITRPLKIAEGHLAGIMEHFVRGGQTTLGGVVNAITAYSQTVEDGDAAHDLDTRAVAVLGV